MSSFGSSSLGGHLVKIYSVHDKAPEFIRFQYLTLGKFLLDSYEFIVCDNANTPENSRKIHAICAELGIKVLSAPKRMHDNPNIACSYPLDWLTQEVVSRESVADFSVFIDSDIFLIKPLSFIDYLGDHQVAAVYQSRGAFACNDRRNAVSYFWNALVIFNHKTIQNPDEIIWVCSACGASPYFPAKFYGRDRRIYPFTLKGGTFKKAEFCPWF